MQTTPSLLKRCAEVHALLTLPLACIGCLLRRPVGASMEQLFANLQARGDNDCTTHTVVHLAPGDAKCVCDTLVMYRVYCRMLQLFLLQPEKCSHLGTRGVL